MSETILGKALREAGYRVTDAKLMEIEALLSLPPARDEWDEAARTFLNAVDGRSYRGFMPRDIASHFRAVGEKILARETEGLREEIECHSHNHDAALDLLDMERRVSASLRAEVEEWKTRAAEWELKFRANENQWLDAAEQLASLRAKLDEVKARARDIVSAVCSEANISTDGNWCTIPLKESERAVSALLAQIIDEPKVSEQEIAESRAAYADAANIDGGQVANFGGIMSAASPAPSTAEVANLVDGWHDDHRHLWIGKGVSYNAAVLNSLKDLTRRIAAALDDVARQRDEEIAHKVAQEAHTLGRIYSRTGEIASPAEEYERVRNMVDRALRGEESPDACHATGSDEERKVLEAAENQRRVYYESPTSGWYQACMMTVEAARALRAARGGSDA